MLDQAKLMKQAWDMKKKLDKVQKDLKNKELTVERGSVSIVITGDLQIRSIKLDPTIQELNNIRDLESAVKNCINQAISEAQELAQSEMKDITGGMKIPGLT